MTNQVLAFDANGGTCALATTNCAVPGKYGLFPTPVRKGHAFQGWFTEPDGGDRVKKGNEVTPEPARTLFAHWTPVSYAVAYAYAGGKKGSHTPTNAVFGTAFYVSAPTKANCAFAGWTVTKGLDSSTAKWGKTSNPATAIASAGTKCLNGEKGNVYFRDLRSSAGSVTLTAN